MFNWHICLKDHAIRIPCVKTWSSLAVDLIWSIHKAKRNDRYWQKIACRKLVERHLWQSGKHSPYYIAEDQEPTKPQIALWRWKEVNDDSTKILIILFKRCILTWSFHIYERNIGEWSHLQFPISTSGQFSGVMTGCFLFIFFNLLFLTGKGKTSLVRFFNPK